MIVSYLFVLFGVCGLAAASLFALKRLKGSTFSIARTNPVRVIGRQQLGVGSTLFVIEYEGAQILVGTSRGSITVIERSKPA